MPVVAIGLVLRLRRGDGRQGAKRPPARDRWASANSMAKEGRIAASD